MRQTLENLLVRKSIGSMERRRCSCGRCGRTPLPGEFLHSLESGRRLCGLCLARLPERERAEVASERVHAAERTIAVAPRAA